MLIVIVRLRVKALVMRRGMRCGVWLGALLRVCEMRV